MRPEHDRDQLKRRFQAIWKVSFYVFNEVRFCVFRVLTFKQSNNLWEVSGGRTAALETWPFASYLARLSNPTPSR